MTQSKYALPVVALIVRAITDCIYAQSSDRDRPTPLMSKELRGFLQENKDEHFYSFTAGPGELTVTADIAPSKGGGTTNIAFELLGRTVLTRSCAAKAYRAISVQPVVRSRAFSLADDRPSFFTPPTTAAAAPFSFDSAAQR